MTTEHSKVWGGAKRSNISRESRENTGGLPGNKTGVEPREPYSGMEMHTDYSYLRAHWFGLEWIEYQIMDIDAFVGKLQALLGEDDDALYCVSTWKEQHGMRYSTFGLLDL